MPVVSIRITEYERVFDLVLAAAVHVSMNPDSRLILLDDRFTPVGKEGIHRAVFESVRNRPVAGSIVGDDDRDQGVVLRKQQAFSADRNSVNF